MQLDPKQKELKHILDELRLKIEKQTTKSLIKVSLFKKETPQSLYIYGSVGCGKSFLMRSFYAELNIEQKLYTYFHQFMQQVHAMLYKIRNSQSLVSPVALVAKEFAAKYSVICLDELEINDITDAMIVGKLFDELLKAKITLVTTSNRQPDDLYLDGLQRTKFLEFIGFLKARCLIYHLNSNIDYRLDKLDAHQQVYFKAGDPSFTNFLNDLSDHNKFEEKILEVNARQLHCRRTYKNIAIFTFAELCSSNLGPADYIALATNFRVIFVENIPQILPEQNNEISRFINLIDELYEHAILLVLTSEVAIEEIYRDGRLSFQFRRTLSRLQEMKSEEYIRRVKNVQ